MKYYLKDHVTDEMLVAVGFGIIKNTYGYKWAVKNRFKDDCILITLHNVGDNYRGVCTYPYDKDVTPIIQDLIQLGYVEVRE